MNKKVEWVTKFFKKLYTRFMNYNNSKKWFILYLVILAIFLIFFPIVKLTRVIKTSTETEFIALLSGTYLRSLIVVLISLIFLLGWNISIKFKKKIIELFSLREDEPLIDFALLWVITSVFMGILDTIGIVKNASDINPTVRSIVSQILLLWGLIRSFYNILQSAKKSNKQTKILNIMSDEEEWAERKQEERVKKQVHLFDDLDKEEE